MGFWSEFFKSFREQTKNNKELGDSINELKKLREEELKRLRESEAVKKTKESVEKLRGKSAEGLSQLKNLSEKAATQGGRVTARVTSTLGDLHQRSGLDGKLGKTLEQVSDRLGKARDTVEKAGESIKSTAGESQLVKKVKESVKPFGHFLAPEGGATGDAAGSQKGPASQMVVTTQQMQTAVQKRLHQARDRLRATHTYKKALALREKIVDSDNPIIQSALDLGDSIARTTSKVFAESEHAKTVKLICSLDPAFSSEKFKETMASSFVPTLRSAILRADPEPIKAHMSKRLAEHELEAIRAREALGYRCHSKLLNLDSVEVGHPSSSPSPLLLNLSSPTPPTDPQRTHKG